MALGMRISDILCLENGLSVIKPAPYKERKSQGRYSRKGHFSDKKLEFLKDIEAKLMEGKGKGYVTWAKRFNAKQMAKTVLFLQEHKIEFYEQLKEMTDERSGRLKELKDSMKEKEALLSENKRGSRSLSIIPRTGKCLKPTKRADTVRSFTMSMRQSSFSIRQQRKFISRCQKVRS